MKRRLKKTIAILFAFVMVLQTAFPMSAQAATIQGVEVATVNGEAYLGQKIAIIPQMVRRFKICWIMQSKCRMCPEY